jgi:LuxR family maltose regulon positive regulatory protein
VLAAKLHPPLRRPDTLLRPRLVAALREHVECKLQLIIAPPGFGKTTLLVDFIHEAALPACWVTLDRDDGDLPVFVATLVEAFRQRVPGLGARTLAALQAPGDLERRAGALARTLATELDEQVDRLTLLVLDDFHEVNDSAPVTAFLDELLRLLPDGVRVIIAGRALPNLTVSRLLVEGQLFGLGEADLRFTADELLTLLRRHGRDIPPARAAALVDGAEGWIAGFLLSVPHMWQGLVSGVIAAQGEEGPLYEYLAAEAFDRQPPHIQRFLLATAVPEIPDLDLCAALLGPGDWAAVRDAVEAAGLFLTRLPGPTGAFRYHQLFRGFLQARLRRTDPDEFARLQRRAGDALARRGDWQAALGHYQRAGAVAEAAALAARIAPELERGGRWRTLATLVGELDPEAAGAHPDLLVRACRAAVMTGNLVAGERFAAAVRDAGRQRGEPVSEGWGYAYLGNIRRLQGRTREAVELLDRALALAPEGSDLAAQAHRQRGSALTVLGDFAGAAAELRRALACFERLGDDYEAALTDWALGFALHRMGEVAAGMACHRAALERWQRLGDAGMEAEMLNCLGVASADLGRLDEARAALEQGLARAQEGGYPRTEGQILHSLGEVLLAQGNLEGARQAFERGLSLTQELGELWAVTQLYEGLAQVHALAGDAARAEEYAHRAVALARRQESPYLEARCTAALGAVQARTGRRHGVETLRQAVDALERAGARRDLVRARLWLAQALYGQGARDDAFCHLRAALALADELGVDPALAFHARWDAGLFQGAAREGVLATRASAALAQAVEPAARLAGSPAPMPELPALVVRAFGPGSVTVQGAGELEWGWEKSRQLFFYLLAHGPRRQEQIAAALWPEAPALRARSALYDAVFRLRRCLHPQAVSRRDGIYRLNHELITFYDVRAFERALLAAEQARPADAIAHLEEAVTLYQGPYLDGTNAEWCLEERRRWERRYLDALERLATLYATAGQPRQCLATAARLLTLDPLREDIHALVIRTHLRLGDRAAALRHFEQATALLRAELGVEPGAELRALLRRIRA